MPEEKTRSRYERNQPLIREAALLADHAYVYDNSEIGKPHRLALQLHHGKAISPDNVPPWARHLYAKELEAFAPSQINSPAASFAAAAALTKAQLGNDAQTFITRPGATYSGPVVGKTDAHTVQQIGTLTTVAHFSSKLDQQVNVGDQLTVVYGSSRGARAEVVREQSPDTAAANKAMADAFRKLEPTAAVRLYPDLAGAYAALRATELQAAIANPKQTARIIAAMETKIALRIERGQALPVILIKETEQATEKSLDRVRGR